MKSESITFEELLMTIPGSGPVMEVAREVSAILRDKGIDGAVIGGVAAVLHGHLRTTIDVDVFAPQPEELAAALAGAGFTYHQHQREFVKDRVPVHLIPTSRIGIVPLNRVDIDGVRTVSLADLLNIKLFSGQENMTRAKDLADVIYLIQHHQLEKDFVSRISKPLREDFRRLVDAVHRDQRDRQRRIADLPPNDKSHH